MGKIHDLLNKKTPSWESVLTDDERAGGPSEWGNSRWQVFLWCPYLYNIQYVKGMKPEDPDPNLELGGFYHELLAKAYGGYMKYLDSQAEDPNAIDNHWYRPASTSS